jgi:hypothetical protein
MRCRGALWPGRLSSGRGGGPAWFARSSRPPQPLHLLCAVEGPGARGTLAHVSAPNLLPRARKDEPCLYRRCRPGSVNVGGTCGHAGVERLLALIALARMTASSATHQELT